MLDDEVLHDAVVAVRVDAQVRVARGGEVDDRRKDSVVLRIARDAVDDTVGLVGEPGAVDAVVRGLRRGEEGEIADQRFLDCAFGSARNDRRGARNDK